MAKSSGQLEKIKQDARPTAELVAAALAEMEDDESTNPSMVALQSRGTRDVLDAAITLTRSQDPNARWLGVTVLGQLGPPPPERSFPEECCDTLLDVINREQDMDVFVAAVFAFGHLGNRRCDSALIGFRNHSEDRVRYGVAFSLCGATSDAAVSALLELTDDPYEMARDWATTIVSAKAAP